MADRQAAHRDRLGLSTDGIGKVDDTGNEECNRDIRRKDALELFHHERGEDAAREAEEQPRQPVTRAPHRRVLHCLADMHFLTNDPGKTVQVLDVFATQDTKQCLRGNHPCEPVVSVHDGDCRQIMI